MPTPKEWQDNLDRIRGFANGTGRPEGVEEPEEKTPDLMSALTDIRFGADMLADELLVVLEKNEGLAQDDLKIVVSSFLTGVILSVIMIIAEDDAKKREDNDQPSSA